MAKTNTVLQQNIENAKLLANKFNDVNKQYGSKYGNYLKGALPTGSNPQSYMEEISQDNTNLINMTEAVNEQIIQANSEIIKNQGVLQNNEENINKDLANLAQIQDETGYVEKQTRTTEKIIQNTLQKNIFAKHVFCVLVVINIILFVIVLGMIKS